MCLCVHLGLSLFGQIRRRITYGSDASFRDCLRNSRLAFGTLAQSLELQRQFSRLSSLCSARQRRQALVVRRNNSKMFSRVRFGGKMSESELYNIIRNMNVELDNLELPSYREKLNLDLTKSQIRHAKRFVNELHQNSDENQINGFFRFILDYQLSPKMHELLYQLNYYYDNLNKNSKKGIVSSLFYKLFRS